MNIVGILGPKLLMILAIWIPKAPLPAKVLLSILWGGKLLWDYSRSKPGRRGLVYRLLAEAKPDTQEIVLSAVAFVLAAAMCGIAACYRAWIPVAVSLLGVIFSLVECIGSIKDAASAKKEKTAKK